MTLTSPVFPAASSDRSKRPTVTVAHRGVELLVVDAWRGLPWLLHGFSTRPGGCSVAFGGQDLNLGYTAMDQPDSVAENRRRLLTAGMAQRTKPIGPASASCAIPEALPLVTLKQMHSSLVRRVSRSDAGDRAVLWGDGLLTNEPGVFLGVQTADCLPILLADRRNRVVAALHGGWRGTLKGISAEGVASLRREFGSRAEDLTAAIGPGIGACCFCVGEEVRQLFAARFGDVDRLFPEGDRLRMDLVEANRRQLIDAGVPDDWVFSLDLCTSCDTTRFFSYRAEQGRTGRMMAVLGVDAEVASTTN